MSPAADAKTLRAAIKSGTFAPVYYLFGDDDYLKDEELRLALEKAVDPATRDFNLELLRGADVDAETLGSILSTPPMMADRRVVVVRDVAALKKEARAMLDRYLERPAPDVLVLLVAPAGAKPDKRLASAGIAVEFAPLSGNRIPRWITYYVEHDLGTTITDGAVQLLQEAVGTELTQLRVELDKLGDYAAGGAINEAAVAAVVGVRPGETVGDFLDAVANRDAAAALTLVSSVLQQPKTSAVTIVMALTAHLLVIGWAQAAREKGVPPARLNGDAFELLKSSGSVFTGRSWSDFVKTCVRAADRWSPAAIDDALAALLDADAAAKTTRLSSDEQLVATLVLSLCGAQSGRRAA